MPISLTPEFRALASCLIPYSEKIYGTAEEMADAAWHTLTKAQHETAKAQLDELLSGKYSEAELRALWRSANPEVSPFRGSEGSCTEFLKLIRSRYDKFER